MSACGAICGDPGRTCSHLLAGVAIVGAIALSITLLALPIITYIILPIAIVVGSIALAYTIMKNTCCGKVGAVALGILAAAVLVGFYFVAPIAVPILILSTLGLFGCGWSSHRACRENRVG